MLVEGGTYVNSILYLVLARFKLVMLQTLASRCMWAHPSVATGAMHLTQRSRSSLTQQHDQFAAVSKPPAQTLCLTLQRRLIPVRPRAANVPCRSLLGRITYLRAIRKLLDRILALGTAVRLYPARPHPNLARPNLNSPTLIAATYASSMSLGPRLNDLRSIVRRGVSAESSIL